MNTLILGGLGRLHFLPHSLARIALVRIFSALALTALLLLAANFIVGLWIGDFNAAALRYRAARRQLDDVTRNQRGSDRDVAKARQLVADELDAATVPRRRLTIHWFLGVASSLVTMLVSSITITYFVGTSRWCKEVVEAYKLRSELTVRSARLKRKAFPWAVLAMFAVLAIAALGATSDASTPVSQSHPQWPAYFVVWHYLAAMLGMFVVAWSFWAQLGKIAENYQVIDDILREVERVRTELAPAAEGPSLPTQEAAPA